MVFKSQVQVLESTIWSYSFEVPLNVVEANKANKRVLCSVNGHQPFHAPLLPAGKGQWFINLNKERRDAYGLSVGDTIQVEVQEDTSAYGMDFPVELTAVFEVYPEAEAFFDQLTPGKKRNLLYIVNKPKKEATRTTKAIVIAEHLIAVGGRLDFKILNQNFKDYNASV